MRAESDRVDRVSVALRPPRCIGGRRNPDGRRVKLQAITERSDKPQGGVISPLPANIYLMEVDRKLKQEGISFVRYADDIRISRACRGIRFVIARRPKADVAISRNQVVTGDCFVASLLAMTKNGISRQALSNRTPQGAREAKEKLKIMLKEKKLTMSEKKTRHTTLRQGTEFLGYRIMAFADGKMFAFISSKAVNRFKVKVRWLTRRTRSVNMAKRIEEVGTYLKGWKGYFRNAQQKSWFWKMDKWVYRRLLNCIAGHWSNYKYREYPVRYFRARGVPSLYAAHMQLCQANKHAVPR